MTVPLVDVKAAYLRHKDGIDAAIRDVVESTAFVQGPQLRAFEEAYAAFCGARHAIGVGSGTAALHLSLAAAGVGAGDVVAVPAHSFIATIEPVSWLGARPRFVEIDPLTGAMDPVALKGAIDGVSAVLPVHIHGRPADLEQIAAVAAEAGVPVIEDAAQAHGAEIVRADGTVTRAGAYGLAGCFSFYPGKNLGAFGDAGAITTNDDAFAGTVRRLRDHGRTTKYEHEVIGYAHRMDTIQAAVLSAKLVSLDADNRRRASLMSGYEDALTGVGDLWFPPATPDRRSVFHHALVRTAHRDALLVFLKERGIGAGVHYPVPLHLQPAYAFLGHRRGDLPATEAWADECLSLPLYPELTDAQLSRVVAGVVDFFGVKVLVVTNLWPEPGSFRGVFVAEQVEGLRKLGHDVDVEVVAQARGKSDYLLAAPRVGRRARRGGYDLVHVHYGLTALAARLVGTVPRVLSLYGSDVNTPWQSRITRLFDGRPAARVYPSRRLVDAAGDPDGVVVPNGIDLDLFTPLGAAEREAARARFGFGPDDRVVLFGAAPDNPVKGYDVFSAVLAGLRSAGLPVRELLLPGPEQTRADVVPKFAAADLLLVTSRRGTESGPLVVKEAAAMTLPVVTVDVGDTAEVLAGTTPSQVVPFPDTPTDLIPALTAAAAPILTTPRRTTTPPAHLSRYSHQTVLRDLESLYHAVIRD